MVRRPFNPAPRAVIFDLDDTLCDYAAARTARLRIALTLGLETGGGAERTAVDLDGMIADSIKMHPHGADHFPELFARYGYDDTAGADRAAEWYRSNRFHDLALFPEAAAVLTAARRTAGSDERCTRALGIVTNGPAEVQQAKVALLGVRDLVDFVVISEEFGVAKPDPAIFHEALRQAGVRPQEAVYVGDSPEFDMAGARLAEIPSVWLNRERRPWDASQPPPDREIRSLGELPALLGSAPPREARS